MANVSAFAATPVIGAAILTAALGGTRTTPTGAATAVTAGVNGTLISRMIIQNIGATANASSANVVALYLHDGTNFYLLLEFEYSAAGGAPSASNAAERFEIPLNDLVLPSGWTLRVGVRNWVDARDDTSILLLGGAI